MAKDFSPEEKLLNLIKQKKRHEPAVPETPVTEEQSPVAVKETAGGPSQKETGSPFSKFNLSNITNLAHIKMLNTVLFAILILIIIYFLVDVLIVPSDKTLVLNGERERPQRISGDVDQKPFSYYSKSLSGKEIFKPLVREERSRPSHEAPPEEIISNFALLGIVSGKIPQAIIEDRKQKKRFFLKEGQSSGGLFLHSIDDGTVTVEFRGEEFGLSL